MLSPVQRHWIHALKRENEHMPTSQIARIVAAPLDKVERELGINQELSLAA